jgi:ribosome maturation factor RimP
LKRPLGERREGEMDVKALVRPVVESAGLELWEVSLRRESGRRVLRVIVDKEGGVDLDAISDMSEKVSRRLDLEGFDPGPGSYSLEVTSPGIERALREPGQFARSVGQRVKVKTREAIEGSKTHVGTLVSADAEGIEVSTEGGELRLDYADVTAARTIFDWKGTR